MSNVGRTHQQTALIHFYPGFSLSLPSHWADISVITLVSAPAGDENTLPNTDSTTGPLSLVISRAQDLGTGYSAADMLKEKLELFKSSIADYALLEEVTLRTTEGMPLSSAVICYTPSEEMGKIEQLTATIVHEGMGYFINGSGAPSDFRAARSTIESIIQSFHVGGTRKSATSWGDFSLQVPDTFHDRTIYHFVANSQEAPGSACEFKVIPLGEVPPEMTTQKILAERLNQLASMNEEHHIFKKITPTAVPLGDLPIVALKLENPDFPAPLLELSTVVMKKGRGFLLSSTLSQDHLETYAPDMTMMFQSFE